MFDIHSDQFVTLTKPELALPSRKGKRGPEPKQLTVKKQGILVSEYIKDLDQNDWEEIKVRKPDV